MNADLLKKLCAVHGVSGREGAIAKVILEEVKPFIDDHKIDALGNLIAHKKGDGKKMMLAGHMDQIGLMVTHITKEGFLYFSAIGGMRHTYMMGHRFVFPNGAVAIANCEGEVDLKDLALNKMYLDIGARDEADAKKYVKIGDVCVFQAEPVVNGDSFMSMALDDRIGCFIMIEALKRLKKPAFDLYFVFTSQEEVGLRGARTSAYGVDPDYALAFDVTLSADTPKAPKLPMKMGGGAAIKIKDASVICHPKIVEHLESCAKAAKIKHQFEVLEMGGTDSGAIHVSRAGVPSGVISIATRHVHSANELCSVSDIEDCIKLTVKALETAIG
ncbi:MAG: M42 family metallopeptidase [Spirochaetes bacterium]|nr:M42 family metallopeptidase [Spirochaetota bacterium]